MEDFKGNQTVFTDVRNNKFNHEFDYINKVKFEKELSTLEDENNEDLVYIDMRSRIMFKEDSEYLSEDHMITEEMVKGLTTKDASSVTQNASDICHTNDDMTSRSIFKEITENVYNKHLIKEEHILGLGIKDEPLYIENVNDTCLINEDMRSKIIFEEDTEHLYKDHVIKEEMVIGPEIIQNTNNSYMPEKTSLENKVSKQCENGDHGKFKRHVCSKVFICDYCNKSFEARFQIRNHIESHLKDLEKRVNKHTKKETHTCNACHKCFKSKKWFQKHVCSKNSKFVCEKSFDAQGNFTRHNKTHMKLNKNIACGLCRKNFASQQNVDRHISSIHNKEKSHKCEHCGKSYTRKDYLQSHLQRQSCIIGPLFNLPLSSKQENQSLPCQFCNKSFSDASNRNRHEKYYCTMNKNRKEDKYKKVPKECPPTACDICEKTFTHKDSLRSHIIRTHVGARNHECDYCQKKYMNKLRLREHIMSKHLKISSFSCKKCKQTFTRNWSLKSHERKYCDFRKT